MHLRAYGGDGGRLLERGGWELLRTEVPCVVVTPRMLEPSGMAAELASHTRVRLAAFHAVKQRQPNGYGSMSKASREKAGRLRNVEGTERERACRRQEAGAGECSVGVEIEHEMSGVCRTGAHFTHLQPTVGLSSATQLIALQT